MSVSDLVRKFKRAATDPEAPPVAKRSFDWEPERAMPASRSSSSKAAEPAPAVPKPVAAAPWPPQPQPQPRPAAEPSSVIGTGIPADVTDFALQKGGDSVGGAFAQLQPRKRQEQERLRQVLSHFVPDGANPVPIG